MAKSHSLYIEHRTLNVDPTNCSPALHYSLRSILKVILPKLYIKTQHKNLEFDQGLTVGYMIESGGSVRLKTIIVILSVNVEQRKNSNQRKTYVNQGYYI